MSATRGPTWEPSAAFRRTRIRSTTRTTAARWSVPAPDQIPDYLTSYGLRTVDGSCNNLVPGPDPLAGAATRYKFASADQPFPRLTNPVFRNAESDPPGFCGPPGTPTSYAQKKGCVFDTQPRVISNLIVDQTSTNPAAVHAAQFPVRTQGETGVVPCTIDPTPADPNGTPDNCVPSHQTLFIPNVTTDIGLSPPYNSAVHVLRPVLRPRRRPDRQERRHRVRAAQRRRPARHRWARRHRRRPATKCRRQQAFMVLTRAQNQPGPDGILGDDPRRLRRERRRHPEREQHRHAVGRPEPDLHLAPVAPGLPARVRDNVANHPSPPASCWAASHAGQTLPRLALTGRRGIGTWAAVKKQAAELLGLLLEDKDVTNIPMIATDPYGKFVPGPTRACRST